LEIRLIMNALQQQVSFTFNLCSRCLVYWAVQYSRNSVLMGALLQYMVDLVHQSLMSLLKRVLVFSASRLLTIPTLFTRYDRNGLGNLLDISQELRSDEIVRALKKKFGPAKTVE